MNGRQVDEVLTLRLSTQGCGKQLKLGERRCITYETPCMTTSAPSPLRQMERHEEVLQLLIVESFD
jgi:hypothetical protein